MYQESQCAPGIERNYLIETHLPMPDMQCPLRPEIKPNPFSLYSHKLHVQHIGFYGAGNPQNSHIRSQLNYSRISRQETPAANQAATCEDLCTSVIGLCDTVVGILGGGQLGRMLCQTASKMGVKVAVLDPLENCPASALAYKHVVGSFRDTNAVQEFAKGCGVLTVEIEHVDVETLEMLEEQGVDCQPNSSTIRLIQMPKGVPVATVAIQNATNAGLLAIRILGSTDSYLQEKICQYQIDMKETVLKKAEKLETGGWKAYLS